MSDFNLQTNTYAGSVDPEKLTPLLLPKDGIVERQLVTLKTGIKKRRVIRDIDVNIAFQSPSAKFNDDNLDINQDETYLDPVAYEVMKEIDYQQIQDGWESEQLQAGSMNDYTPPADEEEFLLSRMEEQIGLGNEELYMLGKDKVSAVNATFSDSYPGLLPRLKGGSDTIKYQLRNQSESKEIAGISTNQDEVTTVEDHGYQTGDVVTLVGLDGNQQVNGESINGRSFIVLKTGAKTFKIQDKRGKVQTITGGTDATTGTAVSINENNVIPALSHAYRTTPKILTNRNDFKMIVPKHVADSYKLALAKKAEGAGNYTVGDRELDFLSWAMEPMNNWEHNLIACWNQRNIFLGLDVTSDEEFIKVVPLEDNTLDQVVRYKARMKSDINAKFYDEVYLLFP